MLFEVTTYALAKQYTDSAIEAAGGGEAEVTITDVTGTISQEGLEKLKESKNTIITLDGKVYRLSRIEGDNYKYIASITDGEGQTVNMTELNINQNTGDFYTKQLVFNSGSVEYLERRLNAHIEDNVRHINSSERDYWNNKVSTEAEQIKEVEYKLWLKN